MSRYYPPGHDIPTQYYDVDPSAPPNHVAPSAPPGIAPDTSYPSGITENPFHPGVQGPFVQYADPHVHSNYADEYDDVPGPLGPGQGASARPRRRLGPGEQVKHRRTRSGCFTCRHRRVKCDESHPVCERCRKGGRECIYPDTQGSQKLVRGFKSGKSGSTGSVSSPEDHEEDGKERLAAILDDEDGDYEEDAGFMSREQDLRDSSNTPASLIDQSTSPSTEASSTVPTSNQPSLSRRGSTQATKIAPPMKSASTEAQSVQFYLNYFKNHMSSHHYSLKRDAQNFIKVDLLAQAMKFEPLKYAVVGYAAYFHTLSQPDGRISTFLQFYNESVSRLRVAITKNKKHGLATFLTILQLASIEEMLGDWVNLMGHQKAAFEMLIRLYTVETITKSQFLLKVLLWYIRFDLFVGFQSGGESVLSREWYVAAHDRYVEQLRENPNDLDLLYEERFAYSRLVAKDSNDLFARKGKGLLSDQEFMLQLSVLQEKVDNMEDDIGPTLLDPRYKVKCIPGEPGPDDIVNPYEPDVMWGEPLWTSNFLLLDVWGIMIMHYVSTAMALRRPTNPELPNMAYRAAQLFEALCAYPHAPLGTIIEAQITLAISTLFLPRDSKTIQWCRRTFAKVEASGYIYSDVMRTRMLESYGLSPSDWWLPNDEACPPIIRSIKNFIHERATAPKDQVSDDLKEMRGIFGSMTISDSPDSVTVTSSDYAGGASAQGNFDMFTRTDGSPESVDWGSGYGGDRKQSIAGSMSQYSV
ncbi:hypothetical protein P153DRAFT_300606 [Dothidotthia symphoricarpi CBS 119687]|uniref:Zn(2)-C6 fungal-type domain-containing protein n=1 Tax=Dothidotthia symphoricarpi CBS 119687 TaxID=1392245 RepID=A0A6A6A1V6_9PLEO|nr:uncharacterized protein P153DRAFT_300606 [Dothidotthia symphoricarpi CBS 119687]KAF2125163.1 hypothetical protein P153DRAFT_300606 [Dothidotthia symphoricarpi CBS 119687]